MPKLLVVDGSPMMHRIMELTFAPEGIQVVTASDGDQAIALLPIARPDIVIADHAVSGRSGYDVSAFVKAHPDLGDVPVLLLASPFEPLDRARADACGVAGEIAKPFEPAHLVARVRELLAPKPPAPEAEPPATVDGRAPALKLVEPPAPSARGALDDYFDRLDAALERLDDQIARADGTAGEDDPGIPTLDRILEEERSAARGAVLIDHPLRGDRRPGPPGPGAAASIEVGRDETPESAPQETPQSAADEPSLAPAGPEHAAPPGRDLSALVEALEALRRRGPAESPSSPVPSREPLDGASQPAMVLSDAMIDDIARRVVARLAPGVIDRIVTDVVTDVAEKLLREEIARLK